MTVSCPGAVLTPMLGRQAAAPQASLAASARVRFVDEVVLALRRCPKKRPIQVTLPPSRGRLAGLANLASQMGPVVELLLKRKGREVQRRMQGERT